MVNKEEVEKYEKAGKIAKEVVDYSRKMIKKDMKLKDIADKIEEKILSLGGKLAFPVSLSINDVAAHYTPKHDSEEKAFGLLKVDLGVHVNGFIADTAFSMDIDDIEENKKLIEASDKALQEAIKLVEKKSMVNEIGGKIHDVITSLGFSPIRNLSGHELGEYKVHAGLTIPNYNNGNKKEFEEGAYAIEPFSTNGHGIVYDGNPSSIYRLIERKAIRDPLARKIMDFMEKEYKGLPFCERWIFKKFGPMSLRSLRLMEKEGILHQYPQLIEKAHGKVSQSEHTILVLKEKVKITTK